jgi:hypothetical protein
MTIDSMTRGKIVQMNIEGRLGRSKIVQVLGEQGIKVSERSITNIVKEHRDGKGKGNLPLSSCSDINTNTNINSIISVPDGDPSSSPHKTTIAETTSQQPPQPLTTSTINPQEPAINIGTYTTTITGLPSFTYNTTLRKASFVSKYHNLGQ